LPPALRGSCTQRPPERDEGTIGSPGTHALSRNQNRPDLVINPTKIAEAFWYLHTQDRSCSIHELQLNPHAARLSY
jgi:hypothetical protein